MLMGLELENDRRNRRAFDPLAKLLSSVFTLFVPLLSPAPFKPLPDLRAIPSRSLPHDS